MGICPVSWKDIPVQPALLKICEDIRENLDSNEHSAAITIDLSKAFDSTYFSGWANFIYLLFILFYL